LGVDAAGDGGKVFLSSVPNNYLSIQNANDGSGNQTLTSRTVPVTLGGTGSNTAPMVAVITAANAAEARSILGLEDAVEKFTIPVSLKNVPNNYLSLSGQEITSGIVPVTLGGTGSSTAPMVAVITATDPAAAREVLEIDKSGTDNSTAVTLANVTNNYLSLNGQEITSGIVPVTLGGTGSSTAPMVAVITAADPAAAREVLEIDKSGTDNSTAVTLANVADNYLSLNGQEITSGIVPVTLGGTGSSTAPMVGVITAANALTARSVLGLGTIAIQNKDAVDIDGGAIDGTPIGSSNASSGNFTTVETTDNISIGGNSKELRFYSGTTTWALELPV